MIVALALSWAITTVALLAAWVERVGRRADAGQLSDGAMTAILDAVTTPGPDTTQPVPRPGICVWPPYTGRPQ